MKLLDLNEIGPLFSALFLERKNRFLASILINGHKATCHVADTGRLREILTANRKIYVVKNREGLKTDYSLVLAKMDDEWILVNTSLHSRIVRTVIEKGLLGFVPTSIQPEVTYGQSRLDFLVDTTIFIEVKASNLLTNKVCLFPDAPTKRGKRHLDELINAKKSGYRSIILILCLRNCTCFSPNIHLDPVFSDTFKNAYDAGVEYLGVKIRFNKDDNCIYYLEHVPLCNNWWKE